MDIWRQAIAESIHKYGLDYYGLTPNILIFLSVSTIVVSIFSLIVINRIVHLQQKITEKTNEKPQHTTLFEWKLEKLDPIIRWSDLNDKKGKNLKSQDSTDNLYYKELKKYQEMLVKERFSEISNKSDQLNVFWSLGAQNTKISMQTFENQSLDKNCVKLMNQATVVANRKDRNHDFESKMRGDDMKTYGNECLEQRSINTLNYPIKKYFDQYIVSERVDFPFKTKPQPSYTEPIVSYCDELLQKKAAEFMRGVSGSSTNFKCLFVALPFYLYQDVTMKEKLVHYAFDSWDYEKVYLSLEHVLPIFSIGKTSGMVVDFGELFTTVLPVYEGMSVWNSMKAIPFGGHSVEEVLQAMLLKNQCLDNTSLKFSSSSEKEILRSIKEKLCNSRTKSSERGNETNLFNLPDGNILRIPIESENILADCTEYFFDMSTDRQYYEPWSGRSIQHSIFESLKSMEEELVLSSLSNLVLCGGSSNFNNLPERFSSELEKTLTQSELTKSLRADKVSVNIKKNRQECVLMGANILMSLSTFDAGCVTKEEFDECGESSIVARHFSF